MKKVANTILLRNIILGCVINIINITCFYLDKAGLVINNFFALYIESLMPLVFIFTLIILIAIPLFFLISKIHLYSINDAEKEIGKENLVYDYETAVKCGKLKLGNLCIYVRRGYLLYVIPKTDIIWAYKIEKINTINAVDRKTRIKKYEANKSIRVYLKFCTINKKSFTTLYHNVRYTNIIIENLSQYNHIIVGYEPRYEKLYKNHFQEFLNIRYR